MGDAATSVADRLAIVRARIADAARDAGRDASDVRLVVVSKEMPADIVREALDAGAEELGENRAQELIAKAEALAAHRPRWHFIGRLQRNKVRALAPHVALWHSIDRPELVDELARHAPGASVLVQVNVAGEMQKGGCAPEQTGGLVDALAARDLDVRGLMTVPPAGVDPRPFFSTLRELASRLALQELSMGMTSDFVDAIAEGATIVRVGSAVFDPRGRP